MNLEILIEESGFGLFGVSAGSAITVEVVCSYGLRELWKVQRVSMWGDTSGKGERGWCHSMSREKVMESNGSERNALERLLALIREAEGDLGARA